MIKILSLIIIAGIFSCEEHGLLVHCPDCTPDEPIETELEAKIDINNFYGTLIEIYEGNLEDGILLGTFTTTSSTFKYYVTINKKYTITARYTISDVTYIAVDSAYPRVKYEKNQCSDPCYFVYDRLLDLRLK